MAQEKRKTLHGLAPGMCAIEVKIPHETAAAIRALATTADNSISGIIRDVIEDVFGEGKPAPAELDTLTPPPGETWARIAVYCSEATKRRGLAEVQRRGLDQAKRRTKPPGFLPAVAWILVQRYGR